MFRVNSCYITMLCCNFSRSHYRQAEREPADQREAALAEKEREVNTVKFLNFRMPENFAVMHLKFKQRGQTLRYFVENMQME